MIRNSQHIWQWLSFLRRIIIAKQKKLKKIETLVTEDMVYDILDKYKEVLTEQRKNLIGKYILSKVQLLRKVYGEKEE